MQAQVCDAVHPETGNVSFFLDNLSIFSDGNTAEVYSASLRSFSGSADAEGVYNLRNVVGKLMELDLTEMTLSIVDSVNGPLFTYVLNCV